MHSHTVSDRVPYTLFTPINVDGVDRATIEIRRLRTRDLRELDRFVGGNLEKSAFLIQRLSGWPPEAIDELDATDIAGLGDIIQGFTKRKA